MRTKESIFDIFLPFCHVRGRRVVPALGLAWSNMVTMRIMVMRTLYTLSQLQRKEIKQEDDPEIASKVCDFLYQRDCFNWHAFARAISWLVFVNKMPDVSKIVYRLSRL